MRKLKINIFSPSRYKISRRELKKVILEYLDKQSVKNGVLNLIFVGKIKMRQLSKKYKQEDVALPVLSFPYFQHQEDEFLLGEIFICYPQAILLAAERNKTVKNILEFLIIHALENIFKNINKNSDTKLIS